METNEASGKELLYPFALAPVLEFGGILERDLPASTERTLSHEDRPMNLLDLFILLVAAIILYFGHLPFGAVIIFTIVAIILVRILRGERIT